MLFLLWGGISIIVIGFGLDVSVSIFVDLGQCSGSTWLYFPLLGSCFVSLLGALG